MDIAMAHCAGTIGAVHDNGEGVAGVMADVSLVAIKSTSRVVA